MSITPLGNTPRPAGANASTGDPGPSAESLRIADDLASRARAVAKAASRATAGDDDTAVHDLRVALRRLNAGLELWGDILRPKPARAARRRIRRMRRALGPLRELESAVQALGKHRQALPIASRVAAEAMLDDLLRRSRKARRRVRPLLESKATRAIARRIARASTGLDQRMAAHHGPSAVAEPRIAAAREDTRSRLGTAVETGADDRLHEARVALKKWRYALEAAGVGDGQAHGLPALRGMQEALGHAHDCAMLRDRVERRSRRLHERGLNAEASALTPLLERIEVERGCHVEQARGLAPGIEALATRQD